MGIALTNEERFLVSCKHEGDVGVRQKLNAGRYGERKAIWAASWLDSVDAGKSDAAKADEKGIGLLVAAAPNRKLSRSLLSLSLLILLALAVFALLSFR